MPRTSSSASLQKTTHRPAAEKVESPAGDENVVRLNSLLNEFMQLIDGSEIGGQVSREKISELRRVLEGRRQPDFTAPVEDWDDFKAKLGQVELEYKRGNFSPDLKTAANLLYDFLCENEGRNNTIEFWRAHSLLYELNDILHLDRSDEINERAANEGKPLRKELRSKAEEWEEVQKSEEDLRLLQAKVLYCACRANELKRAGSIEEARELFEWLLDFTNEKLFKPGVLPCLGVRVSLKYNLGSVYRKLELHDRAEEMYSQTLDDLRQRVMERGRDQSERAEGERAFAMRQQAMAVGIGLGWINLTRGFLKRAENAVLTARSLLAVSCDPLIPAYLELLFGTILRCRAGKNEERLKGAIESLEKARSLFEKHGHSRYVPRACWELALALNLAERYEDVEEPLRIVETHANEVNHPKWKTNVRILRSRVKVKKDDLEGGLNEAKAAIEEAKLCKSVLPLVDAHITLGEAMLRIAEESPGQAGKCAGARAQFEDAQRLILELKSQGAGAASPSNPKIIAVCKLRIAQCYARDGNEIQAKEHFAEWKILRASVEHEWVRALAAQVEKEINKLSMNFTISARDSREWNYAENVARLRSWLLAQALRHTKMNYSQAADIIGVKRGTLYQWQEDSHSQSKRARVGREDKMPKG